MTTGGANRPANRELAVSVWRMVFNNKETGRDRERLGGVLGEGES